MKIHLQRKNHVIKWITVSVALVFWVRSHSQSSQTYLSSGTFIVPAGQSANVTIQVWGGGGGGGNAAGSAMGGGGGGAYSALTTVLSSGTYTVTVGSGGGVGVAGGQSTFFNLASVAIVAAGGGGTTATVAGGTGGAVVVGTGFAGGNGGNGGGGGQASGGGGGGSANTSSAGANGIAGSNGNGAAGGTGGAGTAAGAAGSTNSNGFSGGVAGTPGGGGGGRATNATTSGSAGGNGRVIVTVNVVLPVKFSSIKANEKTGGIQIEWTTNNESNLRKYLVERSANGTDYAIIGETPARNVVASTTYQYFDATATAEKNFYRIRSIDLDGKEALSSIVRINRDRSVIDISLYPNPVTNGAISFQSSNLAGGTYTIRIISNNGQPVYSSKINHTGGAVNQTIQLPAHLGAGMYSLELSNERSKVFTGKFLAK